MIRFIDKYRNYFSVEFICTGVKRITGLAGLLLRVVIASLGPEGFSACRLRNAVLVERLGAVRRAQPPKSGHLGGRARRRLK